MNWRLWTMVRMTLTVQWRAKFPHVYFGLAIFTAIVFRALVPTEFVVLALPAFLFGEPGSLGIFMVAAQRYLERGNQSVVALAVTPLRSGEYVSGLIVASAIVPTIATALIQAGVQGIDRRVMLVIPPLYLIAMISGSLGLILSTYFRDFTRFIIGTIPPILIYTVPLLSFFGLAPSWPFKWIPSEPALTTFGMVSRNEVELTPYLLSVGALAVFACALWYTALVAYSSRVRQRLEFA